MKILAFTDIHADLNAARKIRSLAKRERVDLMLCAGDLTFFGSGLSDMIKIFDIGVSLLIIAGNHETFWQIKEMEKRFSFIENIHLKPFKKDNIIFFGCGGSGVTPNNTPNEMNEENFKNMLSRFRNGNDNLILATHEPPYNTKLDTIAGRHEGSRQIRGFIEENRPVYCICGHFHENEGKEDKIGKTIIINPGPSGKIIEL
jgi:Icc-related predicted phosphoesterase